MRYGKEKGMPVYLFGATIVIMNGYKEKLREKWGLLKIRREVFNEIRFLSIIGTQTGNGAISKDSRMTVM